MNDFDTIISLDWDKITPLEAQERAKQIYKLPHVSKVYLRFSAIKGIHCKVCLNTWFTEKAKLRFRRRWRDDGNRIVLDILRTSQPKSVLWKRKYSRKGIVWQGTDWENWCDF